ncbi:protein zinc induced facilitator-LIKE 1 [Diplogelasinospora grovesii]|uniref:Protein zinc induced facilitator-LIKE 1 n=1 Tax=Diplogelasinospora grovesii TaxID=303347 RepID=A0AAN6NDB8_9PEZI|nr:protein zinc induced facilitator-LIKE 1 [Diplogelasinospora grovesii]
MTSIADIRLQLWILGTIRATEAIAWSSIFPYAYYMIQSFGEVSDNDIPFWAATLVATFTFCEFLSGMIWSRISDRIGRKPTLLIGVLCSMVAALTFGMSRSIALAVASRCIGGLCNPNVGLVPTCTGELATKGQQPKAFSLVVFIRSLGSLVGPVVGGLLADPVKLYPAAFPSDSLWATYRYLLPNLVIVLLQLVTIILAFFFLQETHPEYAGRFDPGLKISRSFKHYLRGKPADFEHIEYAPETGSSPRETDRLLDSPASEDSDQFAPIKVPNKAFSMQVILQILAVSLMAFHKVSSDTVMGTFLALEESDNSSFPKATGGFGFNTQKIGMIFLTEAIFRVTIQATLIPFVISRLGALRTFRWVLGLYPAMYLLTPFLPALPLRPWMQIAVLLPDLWTKVALSSIGYVCSSILITNTAPSRSFLANINGAAASFGCLARAVGPLLTGKLVSLGLTAGHLEIPFWALGAVAFLGAAESMFLADHP